MHRTIILTLLGFCSLSLPLFLLLEPTVRSPLQAWQDVERTTLHNAQLEAERMYHIGLPDSVDGYPDASIAWFIGPVNGSQRYALPENVIERSFSEPGRYVARAYFQLKQIACDTFTVIEGQRFSPMVQPDLMLQDSGATFAFADESRGVKERQWILSRGDSVFAQGTEKSFSWVASDTGEFKVRLLATMNNGDMESDSAAITVLPPPKIEAPKVEVVVPVGKKGPTPEQIAKERERKERAARELSETFAKLMEEGHDLYGKKNYTAAKTKYKSAYQLKGGDQSAREWMVECDKRIKEQKIAEQATRDALKQQEKDRQAALLAAQLKQKAYDDSVARIVPPCFPKLNLGNNNVNVSVATPVRDDKVKFRNGVFEFTVEALENCRLRGFKYFGNENAGVTSISVVCLDDNCDKPAPLAINFTAAMDARSHSQTPKLNLPAFVKGRMYRVRIEPKATNQLGYFAVPYSGVVESDLVKLKFANSESCAFDLEFVK